MAVQLAAGGRYGGDVTDEYATLAAYKLMKPMIDDIADLLDADDSASESDEDDEQ